jgi:flagellar basal-body rod modification protein FlgD
MPVESVNGATANVVSSDQQGFAGLNSETFLKLLLVQLQNQDPLNPTSNEDLLNQLSAMRGLQANIEITDTLKALTGNQQLSTAATYLGKRITGTTAANQSVDGVVDRAYTRDGASYVGIGDLEIPLANVTGVTQS